MKNVICFDFDGVICDSAPETAVTAWKVCRELWPADESNLPETLLERFCRLRPVLHTGYEAIPLMRLIEMAGESDDSILERFPGLRDKLMEREGLAVAELRNLFGNTRDRLIELDQAAWLNWNRFYQGIREILTEAIQRHAVFLITTKQERFVGRLLRHHKIGLPTDRIFGLEKQRTKPQILGELLGRSELQGATFHFIEDRLKTLEDVVATEALQPVRLYLADWGYNTPSERRQASGMPRVEVISVNDLRPLLMSAPGGQSR